ncbi:MAG: radical SAM protein [Deltaproteobacteria bacterium]|nr:radical SAM protein [Deltaproteobacteria bacterium]
MMFLTYTNGTLINDKMADRIAAAGNIMPALSVEGYEAETDARRGAGVHRDVLDAMARLKQRGVLFGISVTPTSLNTDIVATDEFIDFYMDRGASFAWLFTYIPVGKSPELDLMPTPEQRDHLRSATLRWRRTKPLFLGDFWNDGATCGGCLSASRYAFIASDGKVQPCTFVHFYTHNIKDHSLKEIFASPFFASIRDAQPYDRNLLRPCKIIDHPHVLRQLVDECGARPAYPGADDLVRDPRVSGFLDQYSERYAELADKAWAGPDYQDGRNVLVPFSGLVDLYVRYPDRMANAERNTPVTEARKVARAPAA